MQQQRRQHEQQQLFTGDLDFNQAALNFLRQPDLADIWLPKGLEESHLKLLPGDLVGIAAQACHELPLAASEPKRAPDATFTDHLPSSKVKCFSMPYASPTSCHAELTGLLYLCRALSCVLRPTLILVHL